MSRLPVVVVGAGIGGLSAAVHLAAAGEQVVVLEQNAQPGGKMGELRRDGFRWDTGPSVITMRPVFEDLFRAAGRRLEDYLTLLPVDPLTRYFYPDGALLDIRRDLAATLEQIAALERRDVEGYLAYLAYAARIYRITGPVFIFDQPPTLGSFRRVHPTDVFKIDALRTMDAAIRAHVHSPHLRQLLGRFATYVGASPYQAPATLNVIAHVELSGGVWYPQGGIYAIAQAYARLAQELGVEIRAGCRVERIEIKDGQARGVGFAPAAGLPGETLAARAVVANLDVAAVYEKLLPVTSYPPSRLNRLLRSEPSCSGFILLLGLRGQSPQLAHHNIFFSADYRREFAQIFQKGLPPDEPTIYVAITSKTDLGHAPPGDENWFILVNVPALNERFDWQAQAAAYRQVVLRRLAEFGLDVAPRILCETMLTPLDLERLTGARRGALYGMSSNQRLAAFRRPHNRAPGISGLYFAGGTAHPGGGVPMVTLSGGAAARLLLEDYR